MKAIIGTCTKEKCHSYYVGLCLHTGDADTWRVSLSLSLSLPLREERGERKFDRNPRALQHSRDVNEKRNRPPSAFGNRGRELTFGIARNSVGSRAGSVHCENRSFHSLPCTRFQRPTPRGWCCLPLLLEVSKSKLGCCVGTCAVSGTRRHTANQRRVVFMCCGRDNGDVQHTSKNL